MNVKLVVNNAVRVTHNVRDDDHVTLLLREGYLL